MKEVKVVKIAEKVKFWEEQDRINKSTIPRVLKNYELITKLSKEVSGYTEKIVNLSEKNDSLEKKYQEILEKINAMEDINNKLYDELSSKLVEKDEITKLQEEYIAVKKELKLLKVSKQTPLFLAFIAIIISFISIIL